MRYTLAQLRVVIRYSTRLFLIFLRKLVGLLRTVVLAPAYTAALEPGYRSA